MIRTTEDAYMDKLVSTGTLYQQVYQALYQAIQEERECEAITQRLLSHYFQLDPVDKVLDTPIQLTTEQSRLLGNAIERLNNHEPIQYVLGEAPFLGRNFQVNPAVLIPRPETEAMVQDIINNNPPKGAHILDLCTGSGCIAITLQLAIGQSRVWGLDIDSVTLQTAQANAQQLGASVEWLQADLLHDPLLDRHWHIIVSNPPYVRPSEQPQMHQRVLAHEPAQALFVPEDEPLVFYERIVALACRHLLPGGKLYLEINEVLGNEVANLLIESGLEDVSINQDLHGKDRWVAATWWA